MTIAIALTLAVVALAVVFAVGWATLEADKPNGTQEDADERLNR